MRDVLGGDGWDGRDVLDLGCGTGFHLPRWAASRPSGVRRRAAPRPRGGGRPSYGRGWGNVTRAARHGAAGAAAAATRRRRAGPVGVLLRARLRARAARARPGGAPRRDRVRRGQRHLAQHVRCVVPARLPDVRRRRGGARSGPPHGWQRRSLDVVWRFATRADLEAVRAHRARPGGRRRGAGRARGHRGGLRRRTSGGAATS